MTSCSDEEDWDGRAAANSSLVTLPIELQKLTDYLRCALLPLCLLSEERQHRKYSRWREFFSMNNDFFIGFRSDHCSPLCISLYSQNKNYTSNLKITQQVPKFTPAVHKVTPLFYYTAFILRLLSEKNTMPRKNFCDQPCPSVLCAFGNILPIYEAFSTCVLYINIDFS